MARQRTSPVRPWRVRASGGKAHTQPPPSSDFTNTKAISLLQRSSHTAVQNSRPNRAQKTPRTIPSLSAGSGSSPMIPTVPGAHRRDRRVARTLSTRRHAAPSGHTSTNRNTFNDDSSLNINRAHSYIHRTPLTVRVRSHIDYG